MKHSTHNKQYRLSVMAAAVLAATVGGFSLGAQAGKIVSEPTATAPVGFGGWNLGNVGVILNGTQGEVGDVGSSWFDPTNGAYSFAFDSDFTYQGNVYAAIGEHVGIVLAKDWPVGEPSGIKIINDDLLVKPGKPTNCIMATSYLDEHFLDSSDPQMVTCSAPFQSHKRYKLAMLPDTVDGIGSESVDLVFNVEQELDVSGAIVSRDYQVFQKINNWTDGRLDGFTIQVGFGVGEDFVSIDAAQITAGDGVDIHSNLYLTVPTAIWKENQLAVFSEGLFGPYDDKTETLGFFDPSNRAGFKILEYGLDTPTDILHSDGPLGSDYAEIPPGSGVDSQFGPWLPNSMLPYGIFFDDDGDPATDAQLLAWYGFDPSLNEGTGALGWMGGSQDSDGAFSSIPDAEITEYGENLLYTQDLIDDLVNVGLNYIVTLGDVSTFPAPNFTIRITPIVGNASATPNPQYVGATPEPLLLFRSTDAAVSLDPQPEFVVGSLLTARVGDADLNQDPEVAESVEVEIVSTTGLVTTLTLLEQGENRGVFAATLPVEYSEVDPLTTVTMTYFDVSEGEYKPTSTVAIADPATIPSDVTITSFTVADTMKNGQTRPVKIALANAKGAEYATGKVEVLGLVDGVLAAEYVGDFSQLKPNGKAKFNWKYTAVLTDVTIAATVEWTATVSVEDSEGALQAVDAETAETSVTVKSNGKNSKK